MEHLKTELRKLMLLVIYEDEYENDLAGFAEDLDTTVVELLDELEARGFIRD